MKKFIQLTLLSLLVGVFASSLQPVTDASPCAGAGSSAEGELSGDAFVEIRDLELREEVERFGFKDDLLVSSIVNRGMAVVVDPMRMSRSEFNELFFKVITSGEEKDRFLYPYNVSSIWMDTVSSGLFSLLRDKPQEARKFWIKSFLDHEKNQDSSSKQCFLLNCFLSSLNEKRIITNTRNMTLLFSDLFLLIQELKDGSFFVDMNSDTPDESSVDDSLSIISKAICFSLINGDAFTKKEAEILCFFIDTFALSGRFVISAPSLVGNEHFEKLKSILQAESAEERARLVASLPE